jgi:hypothetical protein
MPHRNISEVEPRMIAQELRPLYGCWRGNRCAAVTSSKWRSGDAGMAVGKKAVPATGQNGLEPPVSSVYAFERNEFTAKIRGIQAREIYRPRVTPT